MVMAVAKALSEIERRAEKLWGSEEATPQAGITGAGLFVGGRFGLTHNLGHCCAIGAALVGLRYKFTEGDFEDSAWAATAKRRWGDGIVDGVMVGFDGGELVESEEVDRDTMRGFELGKRLRAKWLQGEDVAS